MEMEQMDSFSMKKTEILKEAKKITRLCGAEISIILLSSNNFYIYTSPTSSLKKIIDQYQRTVGVDLWSSHYEKMQEELGRLKDVNATLKREIMQRRGEEVDGMNIKELCSLEEEMLYAAKIIQTRKNRVMDCRIDTYRKKVRKLEYIQRLIRLNLEEEFERRQGRVVDRDGYDSAAAFAGICVTEAMEVEDSD